MKYQQQEVLLKDMNGGNGRLFAKLVSKTEYCKRGNETPIKTERGKYEHLSTEPKQNE